MVLVLKLTADERNTFFSNISSIKTYSDGTALYAQKFTAQMSSGVHFTVFSSVRFHLTDFACILLQNLLTCLCWHDEL